MSFSRALPLSSLFDNHEKLGSNNSSSSSSSGSGVVLCKSIAEFCVFGGTGERVKRLNAHYLALCRLHLPAFREAGACYGHKLIIAERIVKTVHDKGGKYLDKNYEEMTNQKAVRKTYNALKDMANNDNTKLHHKQAAVAAAAGAAAFKSPANTNSGPQGGAPHGGVPLSFGPSTTTTTTLSHLVEDASSFVTPVSANNNEEEEEGITALMDDEDEECGCDSSSSGEKHNKEYHFDLDEFWHKDCTEQEALCSEIDTEVAEFLLLAEDSSVEFSE